MPLKESHNNGYSVMIHRNDYFAIPLSNRKPDVFGKESSFEKSPQFSCLDYGICAIEFGLKGRAVEAADNHSTQKYNQLIEKPPSIESIQWHEKYVTTQTVLNGFILPEDNPETKGMFPSPEQKGIPLGIILFEKILSPEQIPKFWYKYSGQE